MEEENAEDENFDVSTIDSIKTSLMGPLAGIGDSFFLGHTTLDRYGDWDFFGITRKYFRSYFIFTSL